MLANNVQETTTTTGTGNITLLGSDEFGRTFASQFLVNQKIDYTIDDEAGNFETGIGYLLNSTTLVREYVKDSSNGGALVSFGVGTKKVFVTRDAAHANMPPALSGINAMDKIYYPEWFINYTTSYTHRGSSQMYLIPFENKFKGAISNWAAYIKTASAGAVMRMGIYDVDPSTGLPTGSPLYESDNIPCDSTGLIESPMSSNAVNSSSNIELPDYFFLALASEDDVIRLASCNYTATGKTWCGTNSNGAMASFYQPFTLGTPTQGVSSLPSIGTVFSRNENYPLAGFN